MCVCVCVCVCVWVWVFDVLLLLRTGHRAAFRSSKDTHARTAKPIQLSYVVCWLQKTAMCDAQEERRNHGHASLYKLQVKTFAEQVRWDDSPHKGGTTEVGFLLPLYKITSVTQDFPSPAVVSLGT